MKRILAFLLCAVLLLSFPVVIGSAAEVFEKQIEESSILYQIGGTNHKGGQEFVPSQNTVQTIKVYLESRSLNNSITVALYKGSVAQGSSSLLYQQAFPLEKATKWFEFVFDQAVAVTPGELYSFTVNTQYDTVLYGINGKDKPYLCLNYDTGIGRWDRSGVAAFEVLAKDQAMEVTEMIAALPSRVTLDHKDQVEAARDAYDELSTDSKARVTNLSKLESAEKTVEKLFTAARDRLVADIQSKISALSPVTRNSEKDILAVNQKIMDFGYQYGNYQYELIENLADFTAAVEAYNDIIVYTHGDVNTDEKVDAKDALDVLKVSVNKIKFTEKQGYAGDVNNDEVFNAKDALMILQYSVGKRKNFPSQDLIFTPYDAQINLYSVRTEKLYANTYGSMVDRLEDNGFAFTSLSGSYKGMYCRDSSIQAMAHMEAGDFEQARLLLNFMTQFHINKNYDYVIQIIGADGSGYSTLKQADTTFFFLHAWYLYATKAPETDAKKAYVNGSIAKVKEFANHYLDAGNLKSKYNLIFNESFEHSRDESYWQSYDLLTNVYASQALHEVAEYFKTKDSAGAKKWSDASKKIADGIHKNLVQELDGSLMYAELRGRSQKSINSKPDTPEKFVVGFSWVNLAPMGCDWYAADPEILEHTYQMYLKYGACLYHRRVIMLDACTNFSMKVQTPIRRGTHVIGKGVAWEMLYCKKMGNDQRLSELAAFLEEFSDKMYRETWQFIGGGNDTGNQEQASWLLYANKIAFPQLTKNGTPSQKPADPDNTQPVDTLRVGTYNIHILTEAGNNPVTIANVIRDSEATVVGLQEVDKKTGRNGCTLDQAKALAEELGWYYGYSKAIPLGGGEYGNAIISKYPIESYKTINLTSGAEQRVMGHAVINVGGKKINFLNTHLEQSDPTRATQINEIADYGKNLDNFILTGDFNTSPENLAPIGATILRSSGIDNILLKGFSGGTPVVVNNSYSDHKMVYADISLNVQQPTVTGARIATFNIHALEDVAGNADTIANFIKTNHLEIVGMQEVDKNSGRNSNLDQAKVLAEKLGWYYGYSKAITLGSGEYGTAIISKYPIESYKTIQLGSADEEQRVLGHAVIKAGNHTLNVLNTHLSWQNMQVPQIAEISDYVKNMNSYIITGDFNTTHTNLAPIAGTKVNTGSFVTNEDGAIDNIIVKGYTVGNGTMVETNGISDHEMLYADVTF